MTNKHLESWKGELLWEIIWVCIGSLPPPPPTHPLLLPSLPSSFLLPSMVLEFNANTLILGVFKNSNKKTPTYLGYLVYSLARARSSSISTSSSSAATPFLFPFILPTTPRERADARGSKISSCTWFFLNRRIATGSHPVHFKKKKKKRYHFTL